MIGFGLSRLKVRQRIVNSSRLRRPQRIRDAGIVFIVSGIMFLLTGGSIVLRRFVVDADRVWYWWLLVGMLPVAFVSWIRVGTHMVAEKLVRTEER